MSDAEQFRPLARGASAWTFEYRRAAPRRHLRPADDLHPAASGSGSILLHGRCAAVIVRIGHMDARISGSGAPRKGHREPQLLQFDHRRHARELGKVSHESARDDGHALDQRGQPRIRSARQLPPRRDAAFRTPNGLRRCRVDERRRRIVHDAPFSRAHSPAPAELVKPLVYASAGTTVHAL